MGRLMVDEIFQSFMNIQVGNGVIIIQHHYDLTIKASQIVDQFIHNHLKWRELRQAQQTLGALPNRCIDILEGRNPVTQEARRVIIAFI